VKASTGSLKTTSTSSTIEILSVLDEILRKENTTNQVWSTPSEMDPFLLPTVLLLALLVFVFFYHWNCSQNELRIKKLHNISSFE